MLEGVTLNTIHLHLVQTNQRNSKTKLLERYFELCPLTLGSIFLQGTGLESGGKAMVLQQETSSPSDWDRSMRKLMEKKKDLRSSGKLPEVKLPQKMELPERDQLVSQTGANFTFSGRKPKTMTGLQARCSFHHQN